MFCRECGSKNTSDSAFCASCGAKLLKPRRNVYSNEQQYRQSRQHPRNPEPKPNKKALVIGVLGVFVICAIALSLLFRGEQPNQPDEPDITENPVIEQENEPEPEREVEEPPVSTPPPTPQEEVSTENESDDVEEEAPLKEYYTFGDVITVRSSSFSDEDEGEALLEITVHDYMITTPNYSVEEVTSVLWGAIHDTLIDNVQDDTEIIVFSVTITNLLDESRRPEGVQIWGPNGEQQNPELISYWLCRLMTGPETRARNDRRENPFGREDFSFTLEPEETFEGRFYALYEGDGYYRLIIYHHWGRVCNIYLKLPISR